MWEVMVLIKMLHLLRWSLLLPVDEVQNQNVKERKEHASGGGSSISKLLAHSRALVLFFHCFFCSLEVGVSL